MRLTSVEERNPAHHIGRAIKRAREHFGISQDRLAQLCGVHLQTICRHEQGRSHEIDQQLLTDIAWALGCTPAMLWADALAPAVRERGRPRKKLSRGIDK